MPLPDYWFRLITKDLEAIEMKGPTEQQLRDPKWWDENAPEGATHFFPPSGDWYKNSEPNLQCWAASMGFWVQAGFPDRLEDRLAVQRPTTPPAPDWEKGQEPGRIAPERDGEKPDAYMCPAGCGCLWRDNGDDTMSLYGPKSQSCDVCEMEPLKNLIPVKKLLTKEQRDRNSLTETIAEASRLGLNKHGISNMVWAAGWRKED